MNFKEKYKKYKNKYLNLKSTQFGGVKHKVLVIGGGNPYLYCRERETLETCGFYEIGNHPTSYFGSGKDWNDIEFWNELEIKLKLDNLLFDGVIFDMGSESWLTEMDEICCNKMIQVIIDSMTVNGILIAEFSEEEHRYARLNYLFWLNGLHIVSSFRFTGSQLKTTHNILSKVDILEQTILVNRQGLYPRYLVRKLIEPLRNRFGQFNGHYNPAPGFELVIETNQIDFCRNRIINL
jgi:hypothetical protein